MKNPCFHVHSKKKTPTTPQVMKLHLNRWNFLEIKKNNHRRKKINYSNNSESPDIKSQSIIFVKAAKSSSAFFSQVNFVSSIKFK